jgi:hypothetical protein
MKTIERREKCQNENLFWKVGHCPSPAPGANEASKTVILQAPCPLCPASVEPPGEAKEELPLVVAFATPKVALEATPPMKELPPPPPPQ